MKTFVVPRVGIRGSSAQHRVAGPLNDSHRRFPQAPFLHGKLQRASLSIAIRMPAVYAVVIEDGSHREPYGTPKVFVFESGKFYEYDGKCDAGQVILVTIQDGYAEDFLQYR